MKNDSENPLKYVRDLVDKMNFKEYCGLFGIRHTTEKEAERLARVSAGIFDRKVHEYLKNYPKVDRRTRKGKLEYQSDMRGGRLYDVRFSYEFALDERIAGYLNGFIELEKGGRVLDVCCGTGLILTALALNHPDKCFYGIDISQVMVWEAEKKMRFLGLRNMELIKGDHTKTNFEDGYFDVVYESRRQSYSEKYREEMYRVLKKGGYNLSASILNKTDGDRMMEKFGGDWIRYNGGDPGDYEKKGAMVVDIPNDRSGKKVLFIARKK